MAPSVRFRGQPFEAQESTAAFLQHVGNDPGISRLTVVVAWARYRGLARCGPALEALRERGGQITILLGIDEGGATRPGLILARQLATTAYVFHDPRGGTFHPKVYLAEGEEKAALLVGSSNATPGGLFSNYEASLEATFTLPDEATAPALVGVRGFVDKLMRERELCLALTDELIDQLSADDRYNVRADESARRSGRSADTDQKGSIDSDPDHRGIFGTRLAPIARVPPLSDAAARELVGLERGAAPGVFDGDNAQTRASLRQRTSARVVKRWFKSLKAADAQQLPTASPSAALTLVKNGLPIDIRTYFRNNFFGGAEWTVEGGKEVAHIDSDVIVRGRPLGRKRMTVVHDPAFDAGQGNRTTLLRWGELQQYLRDHDLTGLVTTLERLDDGMTRVTIDTSATGEFIA